MKTLFFDVSTTVMYIGYSRDHKLIDFSIRIAKRDHAKYLVDRIEHLLMRNKTTINDIDQIIIGIGPGSYTGLRISVMVGKMLAYTKGIKLKTVSSLLFMTSGYKGRVAAMIDARRGFVFAAIFDSGKMITKQAYQKLSDLKQEKCYLDSKEILIDEHNYKIDHLVIAAKAVLVGDVHNLIPNYLRKTEAETTYDQKSNKQG